MFGALKLEILKSRHYKIIDMLLLVMATFRIGGFVPILFGSGSIWNLIRTFSVSISLSGGSKRFLGIHDVVLAVLTPRSSGLDHRSILIFLLNII